MTARERVAGNVAGYVDDRTGGAKWMKKNLQKVFPDHWSFLLGEICLYSFVILLLSGTFLTFWFDPSMREVVYEGAYEPLQGVKMSAAYASALEISFEVRGGLLMRPLGSSYLHGRNCCSLDARLLYRCIP
jgi:ubiquinol-cytochrome c reductase cytochrome b subunit